ncbi:hypothetical protein C5610_12640 [Idiomarina sp. OT37-5b]|nr:hypothetical protein C5610_12640 [Idiomarina sp. OT37-5b]
MQFPRTQNKDGAAAITSDLQLFKELRSNPEAVTPEKMKALSLKYTPELQNSWINSETPDEKEILGAWWLLEVVLNLFLSKQPELQFEIRKILLWLAFFEKFLRVTTESFDERFPEQGMMKMFLPVVENNKLILSNERYVSAIKQKWVGTEGSWVSFYEKITEAKDSIYSSEGEDPKAAVEKR